MDIKTTPMITLSSGLVVNDDEFFEQNLVSNLADLFGVSPENIRLTNVVREDSRRQDDGTVLVEATVRMSACLYVCLAVCLSGWLSVCLVSHAVGGLVFRTSGHTNAQTHTIVNETASNWT